MRIALDAMGGDHAPAATVAGAVLFARAQPEDEVLLVGDVGRVRPLLATAAAKGALSNVTLHHASEVVEMDDHASASIRRKRDSSLRVCFELMAGGRADAMVSAGNSGAAMAGALLVLGRARGVERPAIAALLPALKGGGRCLLVDAGANVECRASQLAQFAVMGEAYVQKVLGVERPRVAVLSNGEEDSKGTALTREALALLRGSELDCVGYVEGKDLFSGDVDVVVTDGFTGNVVLKTSEGAAMAVAALLRNAVERSGLSERVGALLLRPTFAGLQRMVDYAEYGGAPLLGVAGASVVAHGRSTGKAIMNALRAAGQLAEREIPSAIAASLERAAAWLPPRRASRPEDDAPSA